MASENVEFITEGLRAFEEGGIEAFLKLADPEIEVYVDPEMANADEFSGHDGFMDWSNRWFDAWSEIEFVPHDPIEVSDAVVVAPMTQRATGAGSGIEVEMEIAWVFRITDGKIMLMHLYKTAERARAAADRIAAEG
jgi:ketosteroid isomerase-like protein